MAPLSRGLAKVLLRSCSSCGRRGLHSGQLVYSEEVRSALQHGQPVVSLESTIITHGMPFPTNLAMAEEVEDIIRQRGATPATVAVLGGRIHVGLDRAQLQELAELKTPAVKTSRRDLPWVVARGLNGGTTVSGTMLVSHMAGVEVFVTGGVGGVHRGGQESMDVSADLTELGRTPVTVVSAGVKSILDIGRTLEYLETQGVCVATLGPTASFPAFYTGESGHTAPYRLDTPEEAAQLVQAVKLLGLCSGILIGVPVPVGEEAGGERIERAIQAALSEAKDKGIQGREVTPYILARLNQLTSGESLRVNLALVRNNARAGADIAVELAKLRAAQGEAPVTTVPGTAPAAPSAPLVVGGSIFDFVVRLTEGEVALNGGTHRGRLAGSQGGVGRNVASALARLGAGPKLASAVGRDDQGAALLASAHLDTSLVRVVEGGHTATYTALLDSSGECRLGVGDMEIHQDITPQYIQQLEQQVLCSPLVVADGNLPRASLLALMALCHTHSVPLFFEPTDLRKAALPLSSPTPSALTYCSPNLAELGAMLATLPGEQEELGHLSLDTAELVLPGVAAAAARLLEHYGISVVMVTLSECGVLVVRRGPPSAPLPLRGALGPSGGQVSGVWYPGEPVDRGSVVSVSGAGDCLAAGFIAGALRGLKQDAAVSAGMQAARQSCHVSPAVPDVLDVAWDEPALGRRLL